MTLERRTPLRRGKKPLRADPAKQKQIDRTRSKMKTDLLRERLGDSWGSTKNLRGPHYLRKVCDGVSAVPEIACASPFGDRPAVEMHEVVKRSRWRGGATVRENVVLLCQAHHDWTEAHPTRATEVGLLASRGIPREEDRS